MLSYTLSEEQIARLKKLNIGLEEAGKRLETLSPDKKDYIKRQAMISNIGSSTRIENAILTDAEIDWIDTAIDSEAHNEFLNKKTLIENKLSKDKQRSIEEVAGCRKALKLATEQPDIFFPLKESDIQGLHRELLRYYPKAGHYLGQYKKHPNSVVEKNHATGQARSVLKTAEAGTITETAMRDLVSWYNTNLEENRWTLAVACEFVFRFLAIHPFQDGNGRLSRILFQLALLSSPDNFYKNTILYVAVDRAIEQSRANYYFALSRCSDGEFSTDSKQYQIGYFLDFMIHSVTRSLLHIDYYSEKFDRYSALPKSPQEILHCFQGFPEIHLTNKKIADELKMPRRTVTQGLKILTEKQFIRVRGRGAGTQYILIF